MPHQRRVSRWVDKATQIRTMGYWVFTIPPELRGSYRTKVALTELAHAVQELLKAHGYARGLRRWHFFGERSGDQTPGFHPHLNALVDGGRIRKRQLRAINRDYAALLGVDRVVVHYEYSDVPAKMVHWLRYVARATFKDWRWDLQLARELHGFRNQMPWGGRGRWQGQPCWTMAEASVDGQDPDAVAVASLLRNVCPRCGEPVSWSRALPRELLQEMPRVALGPGISGLESEAELAARGPPHLPPDIIGRLELLRLSRQQDLARAQEMRQQDLQEELAHDVALADARERGEL